MKKILSSEKNHFPLISLLRNPKILIREIIILNKIKDNEFVESCLDERKYQKY